MSVSIDNLTSDPEIVALTFKQKLESIEGLDVPIFPPTYPSQKSGQQSKPQYTINETKDGVLICDIDSVQSQANRMEAVFTNELADVIPQHVVQAGEYTVPLTELPHRIADAAIRSTDLKDDIHEGMLKFRLGDPIPLARIAPTSLIYGVWDSRDTQVKAPRAIRSEIRAHDVSVFTRSAQYSGAFKQEALKFNDSEWKKASTVGFAPTPSVDALGGILVHGQIFHTASILLNVLRKYRTSDRTDLLPNYLLGLTLGGLLFSSKDYGLRSGCCLIPSEPVEWQTVTKDSNRQSIEVDDNKVATDLRNIASKWAEFAGIELGGEPEIHDYCASVGKKILNEKKK